MGSDDFRDRVAAYLPNPLEMPPVEGVDPSHKAHGKSKKHAAEDGKCATCRSAASRQPSPSRVSA